MILTFNALGVIVGIDTTDEALRQGNVGNTLKAIFQGKNNLNYTANLAFTRSDGEHISGVQLTPDALDLTKFVYKFNDPWFFAKSGTATCTVNLVNAAGTIVVTGQFTFSIEKTDFSDDDPQITVTQYNSLLATLSAKLNIQNGIVAVLNHSSVVVSEYEDGQMFYDIGEDCFYKLVSGNLTVWSNAPVISATISIGNTLPLEKVNKAMCFVFYSNVVYRKERIVGNDIHFVSDYHFVDGTTSQADLYGRAEFIVNKNTGSITSATINTRRIYNKDQIDEQFYNKYFTDANFVSLTANQTIGGVKKFSNLPETVEGRNYTSGRQVTDKDYVDGEVADTDADLQSHKNNKSNPHEVTKSQVGLGNVTNDAQVKRSEMGEASGVATLDGNKKIPTNQLPDVVLSNMQRAGSLYVVNSDNALSEYNIITDGLLKITLNLKQELGLTTTNEVTINGITYHDAANSNLLIKFSDFLTALESVTDDKLKELLNDFFIAAGLITESGYATETFVNKTLKQGTYTTNAQVSTGDWMIVNEVIEVGGFGYIIGFEKIDNTDAVVEVNGQTGIVNLGKGDVGLGNVDNTSDLNKPISTATQAALDLKLSKQEASEEYQAKILHADLSSIQLSDWTLDTSVSPNVYRYTSGDLYSVLGLVNTNDLAEIFGLDAVSNEAIGKYGIYLENVTTSNGETHAYICSRLEVEDVVSLAVAVTKQYANGGGVDDLITSGDIGYGLEIVNSKLRVKSEVLLKLYKHVVTFKISGNNQSLLIIDKNPEAYTTIRDAIAAMTNANCLRFGYSDTASAYYYPILDVTPILGGIYRRELNQTTIEYVDLSSATDLLDTVTDF